MRICLPDNQTTAILYDPKLPVQVIVNKALKVCLSLKYATIICVPFFLMVASGADCGVHDMAGHLLDPTMLMGDVPDLDSSMCVSYGPFGYVFFFATVTFLTFS